MTHDAGCMIYVVILHSCEAVFFLKKELILKNTCEKEGCSFSPIPATELNHQMKTITVNINVKYLHSC